MKILKSKILLIAIGLALIMAVSLAFILRSESMHEIAIINSNYKLQIPSDWEVNSDEYTTTIGPYAKDSIEMIEKGLIAIVEPIDENSGISNIEEWKEDFMSQIDNDVLPRIHEVSVFETVKSDLGQGYSYKLDSSFQGNSKSSQNFAFVDEGNLISISYPTDKISEFMPEQYLDIVMTLNK